MNPATCCLLHAASAGTMEAERRAIDLFAGAGGWDMAASMLGWHVDGVEIMPEAQATRNAAGHNTVACDVRDTHPGIGAYQLLLGAPPCPTFSMAGQGAGRRELDDVLGFISTFAHGIVDARYRTASDERTALVVEPLRVVLDSLPTFVAWEQVPPVLPIWEACAEVLRAVGYSVAVGLLNAEQFGVPQTRTRAFLVARRDGKEARLPAPTHSRYYVDTPERLDPGVKPWVSMADAVGWADGDLIGFPRRADSADLVTLAGIDYRARDLRPASAPALTVTEKARSWSRIPQKRRQAATPCRVSLSEVSLLQTFPAGYPFQGSLSKRFLQAGNAVPPLLALAVLRTITEGAQGA